MSVMVWLGIHAACVVTAAPIIRAESTPQFGVALMAASAGAGAGAGAGGHPAALSVHPELRWTRDGALYAGGASLLAAAQFMDVTVRLVPAGGFDPGDIHWSVDRDRVGRIDTQAVDASDIASAMSVAYPVAIAFASQRPGERIGGTLRRSAVYLEAFVLATGTSLVIKNSVDRPRLYTYVNASQRPAGAAYDVTKDEAFQSMPSSHASSSFCGAAFAMTDHLLSRPHAGWLERVGVSFTGGVLAGMTSTLRVNAGKHFPSDVLVGAAIGTASGVGVPLAHHYLTRAGQRAPHPSRQAWLQAIGGLCAGVGIGIVLAGASH